MIIGLTTRSDQRIESFLSRPNGTHGSTSQVLCSCFYTLLLGPPPSAEIPCADLFHFESQSQITYDRNLFGQGDATLLRSRFGVLQADFLVTSYGSGDAL